MRPRQTAGQVYGRVRRAVPGSFSSRWSRKGPPSSGVDSHAKAGQLALTKVEQTLVDQVVAGEWLDLVHSMLDEQQADEKAMRSWGPKRTIRGVVIRDILRGQLAANPDPHGVQLRGARIDGTIDLRNVTSTVSINLVDCLLSGGVMAHSATLPTVIFQRCLLEHGSQPPLIGNRLTAALLILTQSTITSRSDAGAVLLKGAHLGELQVDGTTLTNDTGPALIADFLTVDSSVFLDGGFEATGSGELGAVRLLGGHISGELTFAGAALTNHTGPALHAETLTVDQHVSLTDSFKATGSDKLGAVRFAGGHISGQLNCTGATLTNDTGPALYADGLTVDQGVFFEGGFKATGCGEMGAVRLPGAHIGGNLECTGATLINDTGPALAADGMVVGHVFLNGGFKATGGGEKGAVRFLSAHISGNLGCTGATLDNGTGPALDAESLTVDHHVFLRDGFKATGGGEKGAVRFLSAHISGNLICTGATLDNGTGPALRADSLTVDQGVFLDGFKATGGGKDVVVNLTGMRVGGVLQFSPDQLEHASRKPSYRLNVDGLTYAGLPVGVGPKGWLQLIRKGTRSYAAQPYQYLAAALGAAGNDGEARDVLITQRQDQIDRSLTGWRERTWARFTGVILGYGYRPSRALYCLLGVVITSVILSVVLGAHGGLTQPNSTSGKPAIQCTALQRIAVGLDLGEPLVSTSAQCDTTSSSTAGEALTIARWTLQALAWALATLFIAGFTSAVRKT